MLYLILLIGSVCAFTIEQGNRTQEFKQFAANWGSSPPQVNRTWPHLRLTILQHTLCPSWPLLSSINLTNQVVLVPAFCCHCYSGVPVGADCYFWNQAQQAVNLGARGIVIANVGAYDGNANLQMGSASNPSLSIPVISVAGWVYAYLLNNALTHDIQQYIILDGSHDREGDGDYVSVDNIQDRVCDAVYPPPPYSEPNQWKARFIIISILFVIMLFVIIVTIFGSLYRSTIRSNTVAPEPQGQILQRVEGERLQHEHALRADVGKELELYRQNEQKQANLGDQIIKDIAPISALSTVSLPPVSINPTSTQISINTPIFQPVIV